MATIFLTHSPAAFTLYYGPQALAGLRKLGRVVLNESGAELNADTLGQAARGSDIIVASRIPDIPARVLDQLPGTIAICRVAVDVRNIDIDAANRNGILVTRASAGFGASVAEWVVGAMIALSRSISWADAIYHAGGVPAPRMGRELKGSTLGVIGYGTIGRHLCGLARAFGMRMLVHDPYVLIDEADIRQLPLECLLANSDYVACLAPATAQTAQLMNRNAFAAMRRTAFFINASRGELVDETALLSALDKEQIAGCALDVGLAGDQMPSQPLASHPRVIATPHIGGLTPQAAAHQAMESVEQVKAILSGRMPAGAVNARHAHRLARLCLRQPPQADSLSQAD